LAWKAWEPDPHWSTIWSTNSIERLNGEIKRRVRVVGIFPNDASALRLITAVCIEQSGRKTPENSNDMFGHPWPFWFQMRDAAMEVITSAGRRRELIPYGDLWSELRNRLGSEVGEQWRQLLILLGYVSEYYHHEVGALPTAMVVSRDTPPKPEAGFFRLAAFEGYLPEADSPAEGEEWCKITARQAAFWREQVEAVFEWVARQQ